MMLPESSDQSSLQAKRDSYGNECLTSLAIVRQWIAESTNDTSKKIEEGPDADDTKRCSNAVQPSSSPLSKLLAIEKSEKQQRKAWKAMEKSIDDSVNKVDKFSVRQVIKDLMEKNIVRGRGLLCRSLLRAQAASPERTNVYAAFIALINSVFPKIGELLATRCILQFRKSFDDNDKATLLTTITFIAHLFNQQMIRDIVVFQILKRLLDNPTIDSVEIAVSFLKECGERLTALRWQRVEAIFDTLHGILQNKEVDKRVQDTIEEIFRVRKTNFKDYPAVIEELDLVDEEEQTTHPVWFGGPVLDSQDKLDVFQFDPDYMNSENEYEYVALEFFSLDSEDDDFDFVYNFDLDHDNDSCELVQKISDVSIQDEMETSVLTFRKSVHFTIQPFLTTVNYDECALELLNIRMEPGQEVDICRVVVDCYTQTISSETLQQQVAREMFYCQLAQSLCNLNGTYAEPFSEVLTEAYSSIHMMDKSGVKKLAGLYAQLLRSGSVPWTILSIVRLMNGENSASESRYFISELFFELSAFTSFDWLIKKILDPSLKEAFNGIFPRENPKQAKFTINFFKLSGLDPLIDGLQQFFDDPTKKPKPPVRDILLLKGVKRPPSSAQDAHRR